MTKRKTTYFFCDMYSKLRASVVLPVTSKAFGDVRPKCEKERNRLDTKKREKKKKKRKKKEEKSNNNKKQTKNNSKKR